MPAQRFCSTHRLVISTSSYGRTNAPSHAATFANCAWKGTLLFVVAVVILPSKAINRIELSLRFIIIIAIMIVAAFLHFWIFVLCFVCICIFVNFLLFVFLFCFASILFCFIVPSFSTCARRFYTSLVLIYLHEYVRVSPSRVRPFAQVLRRHHFPSHGQGLHDSGGRPNGEWHRRGEVRARVTGMIQGGDPTGSGTGGERSGLGLGSRSWLGLGPLLLGYGYGIV